MDLKTTKSLDDHLDDWKDKHEASNDWEEDVIKYKYKHGPNCECFTAQWAKQERSDHRES
jgi:hypothetical protein